ncbi:MAG: YjfB family protein [Limnobacter sp.]|nr:YjfB family protein [Limnobacter sp.]
MDVSPAAMVNATVQFKQIGSQQEAQVAVFKKAMDIQANGIAELIGSVPVNPPLASSGNLGTQLNMFA